VVRLRPYDAGAVQVQIEENEDASIWPHGGVDTNHVDLCQVGDNFMIPAHHDNDEGVEWFILQCSKAKYQVEANFICPWGTTFREGEFAIAGHHYQKYGRGHNTYVLLADSPVAHIEAHLVRACKFPMVLAPHTVKCNTAVYKLTSDAEAVIKSSLLDWFENE
jgi:hypothetical protein